MKSSTIHWNGSQKHKDYIAKAIQSTISVAEGAVRAGKTVDNVLAFAKVIDRGTPDRIHLATGSTAANAKLNIGDCNGMGLEFIFRGRCKWTKYKGNEALAIKSHGRMYIVIFAGGSKADSFKKIRGNSYGMWIATEINLHHDNTIKEAFNRQLAAKERRVFWDLNPSAPRSAIYTDYIDKFPETIGPAYNYEHFTIRDNINISPERLAEIESQYDKGSVWYRRDILGLRCTAEGLIWPKFADSPDAYAISKEDAKREALTARYITVGVDFGGNKSNHTFVASMITRDFSVIVLKSKILEAPGTSVDDVIRIFTRFCEEIERDYRAIDYAFPDCAEQAIINTMQARTRWNIRGSVKGEIIDRIRALDIMLTTGRWHYVQGECDTLKAALSEAVWDDKEIEPVRLDDGSSDVDSLDAHEYSFSAFLKQIVREQ